jgi:hypothetical protein
MKLEQAVVFGDVHGDLGQLQALVKRARERYGADVPLFSLGDLIDRGRSSKEVVQFCVDEGIEGVLGNHEIWLHQLCATGKFETFALSRIMGGTSTLRSYGMHMRSLKGAPEHVAKTAVELMMPDKIPQSHKDYILGLPLFRRLEIGDEVVWLVHSAVRKSQMQNLLPAFRSELNVMEDIAENSPESLLWQQAQHWRPNEIYEFERGVQLFGHTPIDDGEPVLAGHYIALDTGCGTCFPYKLSGIHLPSMNTLSGN